MSTSNSLATILDRTLSARKSARPSYGLRAFARDLGTSHTTLRKVIGGEMQVSLPTAKRLLGKLRLEPKEIRETLSKLRLETEKDAEVREALVAREEVRAASDAVPLAIEDFPEGSLFQVIQILSALPLLRPAASAMDLGHRYGIPTRRVSEILRVLAEKGLVLKTEAGTFGDTRRHWEFVSSAHSMPLKRFHLQALSLAEKKLYELPPTARYSASEMVALGSEQQAELHAICEEFIDRVRALASATKSPDRLYLVSLHALPQGDSK